MNNCFFEQKVTSDLYHYLEKLISTFIILLLALHKHNKVGRKNKTYTFFKFLVPN